MTLSLISNIVVNRCRGNIKANSRLLSAENFVALGRG